MKAALAIIVLVANFWTQGFSKQLIDELTLEEKVGQILMVHFVGEKVNDAAKELIHDLKIGGIIYYNWANQLTSPQQVADLSQGLQDLTKTNQHQIPLLIGVDQEGGLVSRLTQGFTEFPGNKALGQINDQKLVYEAMNIIGQELKACGVNLNFAPVVDVNVNPKNPIIGIRSFGDNPYIVSLCAKEAIEGLKKAGVIATLKHFPGHGDVSVDSHYALPFVNKTLEDLKNCELYPFMTLSQDCDVIMTAHLKVEALDPENCSTFSKKTMSYLRNEIGFNGVVITDSLTMTGALTQVKNIEEAAIKAFNAGCDVLLIGGRSLIDSLTPEVQVQKIKDIYNSLINAVKEGVISQKRLDESVARILALKDKYRLKEDLEIGSLQDCIDNQKSQDAAKKIAQKALNVKVVKDVNLSDKKIAIFAPSYLKQALSKTSFYNFAGHEAIFYYDDLTMQEKAEEALKLVKGADVCIVFTCNAWKNNKQIEFINRLHNLNKPAILIITRDSIDEELFLGFDVIYKTFSPSGLSLGSVYDHLKEHFFK